jgi:hypothetical protein
MTHGILLRIGIYLIGVWALLTAVTDGAYYTLELIDRWGSASDLYPAPSWSALFAYGAFLALVLCTKTDKLMAKLGFGPTRESAGTAPAP